MSFAVGGIVPMIASDATHSLRDPSDIGRWSGLTIRGRDENLLSVITAYQVCRGVISSAPLGSYFAREFTHLQSLGILSPNPRRHILQSLTSLIMELRSEKHSVLLMLDANSALDDTDLRRLCEQGNLSDIHNKDRLPSTYIGSEQRRIDFMLDCPRVITSMRRLGALSYYVGPHSDQ